ncbi:MAG: hypothetical protein FWG67_01125 [Defluviitaleaceae bacterium]|nr:hypothetical protein [Defluviitaleaceae bacterium]
MINQVPNLNHYPINQQDQRFGFLPFVGGLAVGALAGGMGGPRPCCGPTPMPMPVPTQPQFIPVPVQTIPQQQFQPMPMVQGPILETNKFFIR